MELKYFLTWANMRLKTVCGRSQAGKGLQCDSMKGSRSSLDNCGQAARRERVYDVSTGKELTVLRSRRGKDGVGNSKEKGEEKGALRRFRWVT